MHSILIEKNQNILLDNKILLLSRGVNLAQPTGLGLDPCGLGPKKPTLKNKIHQRSSRGQKPHKSPVVQGKPTGFHLQHEKYIIF